MKKAFFAFALSFLAFLFFLSGRVFAESNFSTDYNVTYTINNNSITHVNMNVVLTNLTDKYYASSYSIQVGFTDIKNLVASDSEGSISPKLTQKNNGSSISLDFNRHVVGNNNKLNFNIFFDTSEVAENLNNTWDINIPGIAKENDFSSFNATVLYPYFLGAPTYIKPALINQTASSSGNRLFFTKQDLGGSGISIAFGKFQVYNFNLKYHLENKNLFPISTEIALPPSTNYQDVAMDDINPKPVNVRIDNEGNWLARYVVNPSKKTDVSVTGNVKVYLSPKDENLDNYSLQEYLKPQQYWNSDSPKIIELSKTLKTPYAIYQYVVKTLKYDFTRVESNSPRLGAREALNNPNSAVCLEFTDLFIALARAAGIPAREVDGYAYTSNTKERPLSLFKDILHAWPEYYDFDKKTWIMVDPTWGNTTGGVDYFNTLDFDHIAFVIKGQNSNYPVPAGGYKLSLNKETKDVDVKIGSSFDTEYPKPGVDILTSDTLFSGMPIHGYLKIRNNGKFLLGKQQVNIETSFLKPNSQSIISQEIPPFGYELIPLSFDRTSILTNNKDSIKIAIGNYQIYKNVKILPFFVNKIFLFGGLAVVSIILIVSVTAYIFRRISFFRQKE